MTPSVFLKSLDGYSTGTFRFRLIQLVRKKELLESTEEAENVLARLCLSLERNHIQARLRREGGKFVEGSTIQEREKNAVRTADDFDTWYEKFFRRTKLTGPQRTFEILDELSLLLEQVRGNRQSRAH